MNTDRIEKKILLRASPKRVWRALSDSREFGTWFGVKFDGQFQNTRAVPTRPCPYAFDFTTAHTGVAVWRATAAKLCSSAEVETCTRGT